MWLMLLVGCGTGLAPVPPGDGGQYQRVVFPEVARTFDGLSGLAQHPDGQFWAAPERGQQLVPLDLDPPRIWVDRALPIRGLPAHVDIESLTFLPDGTAVVGTESAVKGRSADLVLWLSRTDDAWHVSKSAPLDWTLWGLKAVDNHGVEGLCSDQAIWAVGEGVIETDGSRVAPLARWDTAAEAWVAHRLRLTSDTGKIAGLWCGEGEAWAIERHFGVQHVLRFQLPKTADAVVEPTVVARPGLADNLEAVVVLPDAVWLLSDNAYGRQRGQTVAVRMLTQPD
jgi:hypothetical protein